MNFKLVNYDRNIVASSANWNPLKWLKFETKKVHISGGDTI
jgi:hypothetical protein